MAVLVGMVCYGQNKSYCELVGQMKILTGKVSVSVDFGQQSYFKDNRLVDDKGEVMTFNSMVDAMNYMATLGWEFEQAYVVTIGSGTGASNVYHWLLSKNSKEGDSTLRTKAIVKKEMKEEETKEIEQPQEPVILDLEVEEKGETETGKKAKKVARFVDPLYKK